MSFSLLQVQCPFGYRSLCVAPTGPSQCITPYVLALPVLTVSYNVCINSIIFIVEALFRPTTTAEQVGIILPAAFDWNLPKQRVRQAVHLPSISLLLSTIYLLLA